MNVETVLAPLAPNASRAGSTRLLRAHLFAVSVVFAAHSALAHDKYSSSGAPATAATTAERQLDIPSQPLADALVAFGKATGLEVFYDGALAIGRQSTEVRGALEPMPALQLLLSGTGYVPQATDYPGTITIVAAPRTMPPKAMLAPYEAYFAVLQSRFAEMLCRNEPAVVGREQVLLKFWIDASGVVSRAQVLGPAAGGAHPLANGVRGLRIGKAPPAGLPQPVTMAIYPTTAGEAAGCVPSNRRDAGG